LRRISSEVPADLTLFQVGGTFRHGLISGGVETALADILIALFAPAILPTEEVGHRAVCAENMHRLALAVLLYQSEHGKLPDENWVEQVIP
jgi:hypothetical protein